MKDRQLTKIDKAGLFKELKEALDRPLTSQETERRELSWLVEPHLRQFYQGTMPRDTEPHTSYNAQT